MPPWLRKLLGADQPSLSETIAQVLGRNQPTFLNEIHPDLYGGRYDPVQLPKVSNVLPHEESFVQDTLAALAGGPIKIREGSPGVSLYPSRFLQPITGSANPVTRSITYRDGNSGNIPHEVGHIIDYRDIYPDLETSIASRRGELDENTYSYARTNQLEHFASAVGSAIELLRAYAGVSEENLKDPQIIEQFTFDIEELDSYVPGTREAVLQLSKNPIYGGRFSHLMRSVQPDTYSSIVNFDLGPR